MKKTVNAIVVTYNRKYDLVRCIRAILKQSISLTNLLIIDNASTDDTFKYLVEQRLSDDVLLEENKLLKVKTINSCDIWIYRNNRNTGGSGGFHIGLKLAHKKLKADLYWLMDDDGYPSPTCLEELAAYSDEYDYIMPTSIDIENHYRLSWAVRKKDGKKTIRYNELKNSWGEIMDYVTPFNGILISNKCVNEVGYINKNFFIWGDEYDHYWRCVEKGYKPVTLMSAKFYHPSQKLPLVPIIGGLFHVPYVDSKLRMICLARNYTYVYRHYRQWYKIPIKFLLYTWLFLITRRGDMEGWKLYCASVKDGFKEDFSRHWKYL